MIVTSMMSVCKRLFVTVAPPLPGGAMSGQWFRFCTGGAGPTWGIALNDRQVVQLEGCIASAAGEPYYMVLPVVDKLGALLDVDVVRAHIEHYSNVAFVLRRGGDIMTFHEGCYRQQNPSFHVFSSFFYCNMFNPIWHWLFKSAKYLNILSCSRWVSRLQHPACISFLIFFFDFSPSPVSLDHPQLRSLLTCQWFCDTSTLCIFTSWFSMFPFQTVTLSNVLNNLPAEPTWLSNLH